LSSTVGINIKRVCLGATPLLTGPSGGTDWENVR